MSYGPFKMTQELKTLILMHCLILSFTFLLSDKWEENDLQF